MISEKQEKAYCNYCGNSFIIANDFRGNEAVAKNYVELANAALQSCNFDDAYSYYTKALEIEPHNYLAWFGKATMLFWHSTRHESQLFSDSQFEALADDQLRKIDEAKSYFDKAVLYAPETEKHAIEENSKLWLSRLWVECAQIISDYYQGGSPSEYRTSYLATVEVIVESFDDLLNVFLEKVEKEQQLWALSIISSICQGCYLLSEQIARETGRSTEELMIASFSAYARKYDALRRRIDESMVP